MVSPDLYENKLKNLYERHKTLSLNLMDVLDRAASAIETGDAFRIGNYALLEKDLVNKVFSLKKIIHRFESSGFTGYNSLAAYREEAEIREKIIKTKSRNNILSLKKAMDKVSAALNSLSPYSPYPGSKSSFSRRPAAQFIDLSI